MNPITVYGDNFLIPLKTYNQKFVQACTFQPLKKSEKLKDLMLRIGAVVFAIFAYPVLGAAALIGKTINFFGKKDHFVSVDFTTTEICDFEKKYIGTKVINGSKIPGSAREKNIGDYDWKEKYKNQEFQKTSEFVKNANSAIIAYSGVFSNFDAGFDYTNFSSTIRVKSAEHLFQSFKLPALLRDAILNAPNAREAKKITQHQTSFLEKTVAGKDNPSFKPEVLKAWMACQFNLMVYVQLKKAADPKTKFYDALMESKNAFIIEDGSSQPPSSWTDKGENKLGVAQMRARGYLIEIKGLNAVGEHRDLATFSDEYFLASVQPLLNKYYEIANQKGCFS